MKNNRKSPSPRPRRDAAIHRRAKAPLLLWRKGGTLSVTPKLAGTARPTEESPDFTSGADKENPPEAD